ncbi:Outer-membrane lipoprotein carrier protein [Candidatus Desulfarcum epimagneticum]|uniref:Outer-membrane lipoprotein carrier protein n=1 Tax=uncultured Desulfobacteraceae bacterium TaxID=218296 RepID=A0A484HEW3_9BACT|nr:Outer-membrane lipoprotein carrier protein [uncultured Desulfobacteraceae bacterium]
MMTTRRFFFFFALVFLFSSLSMAAPGDPGSPDSLHAVIERLEKKYAGASFSADFFQTSEIKALDIQDSARGRGYFKAPGKMRWEYDEPEKQLIVTDGRTLWIYHPKDRQVMTGNSPTFFGEGKGGSFLMFIKSMRERFVVSQEKAPSPDVFAIRLEPVKKETDTAFIRLFISKDKHEVSEIITQNVYGDETSISMRNVRFGRTFDDSMFTFSIPDGVDVVRLD